MTGETRRIIEALFISAAQREADVAECTAFFTDQAARQQQTAIAFDERICVHGGHGADGETHKVSMLGSVSAYEQVTRVPTLRFVALSTCTRPRRVCKCLFWLHF